MQTVQVWKEPSVADSTFYAIGTFIGTWQTFKGALSPQAGTVQPKDGCGWFSGGYTGTFTATSFKSAFGYKGFYNYDGTKKDILLNNYGTQTGAPGYYDWMSIYFGVSYTTFNYLTWGWTYHYGSQTCNNNYILNTGDIVT